MLRISVLTLFPEQITANARASITGRALQSGLFELNLIDMREQAVNAYGQVDDQLYGGGPGMLLMAEPVWQSWLRAIDARPPDERRRTVCLSPRGRVFSQPDVPLLAALDHLILICGHYEGIDQRVLDEIGVEELSVGDFVLTGGELPACLVIDATVRAIPGVLADQTAYADESHVGGTLEHAQYTRPPVWHERAVPPVLLSGHQAEITRWRRLDSLERTRTGRPDLFEKLVLREDEWQNLTTHLRLRSTEGSDKIMGFEKDGPLP